MEHKYILSTQEKWKTIKAHHFPILVCMLLCLPFLQSKSLFVVFIWIPAFFLTLIFPIPYYCLNIVTALSIDDPHKRATSMLKLMHDFPYMIPSTIIPIWFGQRGHGESIFPHINEYVLGGSVFISGCFSLTKILGFLFGSSKQ